MPFDFKPRHQIHRGMASLRVASALGLSFLSMSGQTLEVSTNPPVQLSGPFVESTFPFLGTVLEARKLGVGWPVDNLTPRGLVLNLGHHLWVGYDTELLRVSLVWEGDVSGVTPVSMSQISYRTPGAKVGVGESLLPTIVGTPWLANGLYPGWQLGVIPQHLDPREPGPDERQTGRGPLAPYLGRLRSVVPASDGAVLDYEVAGVRVREWLDARSVDGRAAFQRRFWVERVPEPLILVVGRSAGELEMRVRTELTVRLRDEGVPGAEWFENPDGIRCVRLAPRTTPVEFAVTTSLDGAVAAWGLDGSDPSVQVSKRWAGSVVTRGELSKSGEAYVVDNVLLPTDNPWKRQVRLTDIAFLPDGRAAAVTFDGDVWMIAGLEGDLSSVQWTRFTSGLHEPMSLCERDGELFVFDRNGIWRLVDADGNGEADRHELFCNAFTQGAETREYAQSLRRAPDGSFVIAKGGIQGTVLGRHNGSVLRISPDGRDVTVLGYGLRSPFATVHPRTGLVTASDQQGNYVPTTPIHVIRDGQFYGFLSELQPKEHYPAPIAEPATWIPYPVNPSGAGQVWLNDARMGPLAESLVHIGYYRPELFAVLWNSRTTVPQAAVVSLTRDLVFAPLQGAINPRDGQLYVTGLQIWGSVAREPSGLARLRYTGEPSTLPREIIPTDLGVLIRFDMALDPTAVLDLGNFAAERWNLRRTSSYGSPHFKPDGSKGQELMRCVGADVSRDRKGLLLRFAGMTPVMQMRVGWSLRSMTGRAFEQNVYFTPRELIRFDAEVEGFETLRAVGTLADRPGSAVAVASAEEGRRLAEVMGCAACHSVDGTLLGKVGPTWKGLFGIDVILARGDRVVADEAYLRESIREPAAKVVKGYDTSDTSMPSYEGLLSDVQVESLVLYLKSLK